VEIKSAAEAVVETGIGAGSVGMGGVWPSGLALLVIKRMAFVSFHEVFVVDESSNFEFFSAFVRDSISGFRHRYGWFHP
jgi:hypothetical protein